MLNKTILALPTAIVSLLGIFYSFFLSSQDFVVIGCFAVILFRSVVGLLAKEPDFYEDETIFEAPLPQEEPFEEEDNEEKKN